MTFIMSEGNSRFKKKTQRNVSRKILSENFSLSFVEMGKCSQFIEHARTHQVQSQLSSAIHLFKWKIIFYCLQPRPTNN